MTSFRKYSGYWLYTIDGDEEHLYRAISPRYVQSLAVAGDSDFYAPYEPTDYTMDVGPHKKCQVIRIRRFPFQVRIQEMTRGQALKSVLFLIDFARYCHEEHGVTPSDIHEGNFLWWDRPYFVDYDAIRPLTHDAAAATFARIGYCLYRYFSRQPLPGHEKFDFITLRSLEGWMGQQTHLPDFTDPGIWRRLRDVMSTLKAPEPAKTHWSSEYAIAELPDLASNPKFAKVLELAPSGRTMLDVGCNRGYVGRLLRDRYEYILGFDNDEGCIQQAESSPGLNFACFGIQHLDQQASHPILERFHADVVIALAVTHHFKTLGFPVPMVSRILAGLTKKYLLLEDIELVGQYHEALKAHGLEIVEHVPSHPSGRMLTLWRKQ